MDDQHVGVIRAGRVIQANEGQRVVQGAEGNGCGHTHVRLIAVWVGNGQDLSGGDVHQFGELAFKPEWTYY